MSFTNMNNQTEENIEITVGTDTVISVEELFGVDILTNSNEQVETVEHEESIEEDQVHSTPQSQIPNEFRNMDNVEVFVPNEDINQVEEDTEEIETVNQLYFQTLDLLVQNFLDEYLMNVPKDTIRGDMNSENSHDFTIIYDYLYDKVVRNPIPPYNNNHLLRNEQGRTNILNDLQSKFTRHLLIVVQNSLQAHLELIKQHKMGEENINTISTLNTFFPEQTAFLERVINGLELQGIVESLDIAMRDSNNHCHVYLTNTRGQSILFALEYTTDLNLLSERIINAYNVYKDFYDSSLGKHSLLSNMLNMLHDIVRMNYDIQNR